MWHSRVDPICPPRRRASTTYIPAKALARFASHAAPASCGRLAWLHNGREIRSPTSGTITTGRPRPPSQKKPPRVPHAASKNLRQIPQPQVQADFTLHYEWPHSPLMFKEKLPSFQQLVCDPPFHIFLPLFHISLLASYFL